MLLRECIELVIQHTFKLQAQPLEKALESSSDSGYVGGKIFIPLHYPKENYPFNISYSHVLSIVHDWLNLNRHYKIKLAKLGSNPTVQPDVVNDRVPAALPLPLCPQHKDY